ncbi:unnamed protein product [Thlaspi arvense]|uniref:Bifunctional inhibitor/plant lipid transfer protein/seed storage helical domain-containing protein n=1 Tax=Thlaspi arvense TaxID=13288 RepID=A0AAU9T1R0_THLAR|nr:unnamed protein product [Thlaspi arvense]
MAYTNKVSAATTVLFLAVMIAPRWTEAQSMPKLDPVCTLLISDIVQICYLSGNLVPSEECCTDLKSASNKQVTCLCDNLIAHPSNTNLTHALFEVVHTTCGVSDKFTCKDNQMAYTNKVSAVAVVLFLAVAIVPGLAEPQSSMFPKMDPICATVMPDLLEKCFATVRETPTDDCCNDLKSATTTQVTCLCDNYIANPAIVNITGPYSAGITTKCGVFDKYSCDGTSNGTYT